MLNRREFLSRLTAAGCALVFGPAAGATPRKIKIGVLAPSHCALPPVLADTEGLFKKSGVNAELVFMKGMPDIVRRLYTGELDFGQVMSPITLATTSGHPKFPPLALAATQVLGTNGGTLAVSADSGIKKFSDLKNKRIGIHNPFMIHSLILNLMFEKYNLNPGKDIELKIVPMQNMGQAVMNNEIDGFINPEPIPTFLENKMLSRTLVYTRMFWLDHPCCLLVTPESRFKNEKKLVKDVTLACMIAGLKLDSAVFRKGAIAEVHNSSLPYKKIPLPFLEKAFGPRRSDFYPFPYQSSGVILAEQMKKGGLLASEIDAGKLVNDVFKFEYALEIMQAAVKEVRGAKMPPGLSREEKIKII